MLNTPLLEENDEPEDFKGIDVLRAIRSFDPCMPCTTHIHSDAGVITREVNTCACGIDDERDIAVRVIVAGVGYRNLRDHSVGVTVADRLLARAWASDVVVEDLSYNPIAVMQRLEDEPTDRRFDAGRRGGSGGARRPPAGHRHGVSVGSASCPVTRRSSAP